MIIRHVSSVFYLSIIAAHQGFSAIDEDIPCGSYEGKKYDLVEGNAKCIDGSSPSYFFKLGQGDGTNKWNVKFVGGAWCYSLTECQRRSNGGLGSSNFQPKCSRLGGTYTGIDRLKNPTMWDYNTVVARYCDGGSFAGDIDRQFENRTLYFRGKHNRNELIRILLTKHGMSTASEIVISGCSAGGLGVLMGIDEMADIIRSGSRNSSVGIMGLVDSGFFPDFTNTLPFHYQLLDPKRRSSGWRHQPFPLDFSGKMRDLSVLMNLSSGVNHRCVQAYRHLDDGIGKGTRCVFAQYLLPFIRTPVFLMQSRFDSWHLWNILGHPHNVSLVNDYGRHLSSTLISAVNRRRQNMSQQSISQQQQQQHGVFLDACTHHCMMCQFNDMEDVWNGRAVLSKDGRLSPARAFAQWRWHRINENLNGDGDGGRSHASQRKESGVVVYGQEGGYPCRDCCNCSIPDNKNELS
eukprot:gene12987-27411_t